MILIGRKKEHLTQNLLIFKLNHMFAAIACDLGNEDQKQKVNHLLLQYGFAKVLENVYESTTINETQLLRLKRELDTLTDSYDNLRFYQYPLKNTLIITSLKEKKWRKLVVRID